MQRVRVGLTGLSCVFLLVLLAAAFLGLAPKDRNVTDSHLANASANAADADKPKDPLAELGVTPGGGQPDQPPAKPVPSIAPPAR